MRRFKIINIDNYDYTLIDDKLNKHEITIEFHGLVSLPQKNDYIFLSDEMLEEHMVCLGPLGSKYGNKLDNINDSEFAVLKTGTDEIKLQKYYG